MIAAYNNRGNARYDAGDLDGAIADYTKAIHLSPRAGINDDGRSRVLLAFNYNGRGNALLAQGKLDQAIADYSQAIELAPQFADAYANRGLVLLLQGKASEAERDFEQSLRLAPTLKATLETRINRAKQKMAAKREDSR